MEVVKFLQHNLEFHSFNTARRTLTRYKAMNILRKGQLVEVKKGDVKAPTEFVFQIFGIAASEAVIESDCPSSNPFYNTTLFKVKAKLLSIEAI